MRATTGRPINDGTREGKEDRAPGGNGNAEVHGAGVDLDLGCDARRGDKNSMEGLSSKFVPLPKRTHAKINDDVGDSGAQGHGRQTFVDGHPVARGPTLWQCSSTL